MSTEQRSWRSRRGRRAQPSRRPRPRPPRSPRTQRTARRLNDPPRSSAADRQAHPPRLDPRQHRRAPRRRSPWGRRGGAARRRSALLERDRVAWGTCHRGRVHGALRRDRRIAHRCDARVRAHRSDPPRCRAARAALPLASPARSAQAGTRRGRRPAQRRDRAELHDRESCAANRARAVMLVADQLLEDPGKLRCPGRRLRPRARRSSGWHSSAFVSWQGALRQKSLCWRWTTRSVGSRAPHRSVCGDRADVAGSVTTLDARTSISQQLQERCPGVRCDAGRGTANDGSDSSSAPTGARGRPRPSGGWCAARGRRPRRPRRSGGCRPWPSVRRGEVAGDPAVELGAVLVETDQLRVDVVGGELGHDGVERGDRRGVPDVGVGEVDDGPVDLVGVVEEVQQLVGGGEEQLAGDVVDPGAAIVGVERRWSRRPRGPRGGRRTRRPA